MAPLISLRLGFRRTDRKFLRNRNPPPNFFLYKLILKLGLKGKRMLDTSAPVRDILAPRQFGTRTIRHLCETVRHPDNSDTLYTTVV